MKKIIYNVYISDYATANKLGVTEENKDENKDKEKEDLSKLNEKLLKRKNY